VKGVIKLEVTQELLLQCLEAFRQQQIDKQKYQDYYDGKHDILANYKFNPKRANTKIVVNWFKKFLQDELAYSLNNPVNYIDRTANPEFIDRIDLDFSTWEKLHNQKLMLKANTFGHAYELRYLKDNEFKASVLTPLNCFVLEGNDAEKTPLLAMHFYKENQFSEVEKVDVYLPNNLVRHFIVEGEELVSTGESTHAFPEVPIRVVEANIDRKSMLDDIKDLIDSYNTTISNMVNELSDFRMALIKIVGTRFENEDDISMMVEKGVIEIQTGADIDYLIKNLPDQFANSTLKEIKENIYKQASHIDTNEKLQSNTSSSALRGRLITLENKCATIHTMLEQCIKSRLKDYFFILKIRENVEYDYRLISTRFTMNVPTDLLHLADIASKLKDIFALETLYGLFPFVESPSVEYQKFLKERESLMGNEVDLDAID
jgi:SPP1 family phage portal protein